MDIIIQNDGIVTPFNIQSSRETRFTLLPQTRDATDSKEAADGEIDFGTTLGMGEFTLHGIIEFESINERNTIEYEIRRHLNDCRKHKQVFYECSPEKYNIVRLTGRPEITRFPHHLEIRAQFKADPFWRSTIEHMLTGSGTLVNAGTFETPLIIEITGPATNPSVTIGDKVLAYTGTILSGQKLIITVIEDGAGTAILNGANAMIEYNGLFPLLQPGSVNVTADNNVTIRWRDRWI
jgi:phage-related protein